MKTPTLQYIENLARQAGAILRTGYQQEHQVNFKGTIDLVTEIDHQSEEFLVGKIKQDFPNHHILAEESGGSKGDGHQWYIDPLDGTVNYAHHIPIFCVSIAYASNGTLDLAAVYDPVRDEMFSAERGAGAHLNGQPLQVSNTTDLQKSLLVTGFPYDIQNPAINNLDNFVHFAKISQGVRRLGSAAIDLCYVAAGRFDGFWEMALQPWDVAAGGLIAQEAGATVTNIYGQPDFISPPQSVLATAPGIHARMLDELKRKDS
ncbi:MAG: inositol monophosphatase family protein [Anaerolineales bacterium]